MEINWHLPLSQVESLGQFSFPPDRLLRLIRFQFFYRLPDGDVPAVVELLLQLEPLVVGVDHPVLVLRPRPP